MRTKVLLGLIATVIAVSSPVAADTLELVDGTLVEGSFVGGNPASVMFEVAGQVEVFNTSQVVAVWFSAGVDTAIAVADAPPAAATVVPEGTRLMVRLSETIDSRRHSAGHRFRGQLEGALFVQGVQVAPRGAWVYGRVTQARQSGRVAGSSELALEFTDIMIDNRLFQISTTGLQAQTGNTAGQTVGRTARAAAVGGLIGGSSGARTGAKVGAGASILTSGNTINIPSGTLVEATLRAPLSIQ
jgi:hypothetical protein